MSITFEGDDFLAQYRERGMASEMGFGQRPAVLVVDFILGFTDPESPLGAVLNKEVDATRLLLDAARTVETPIFFTTTVYGPDCRDAGHFVRKIPALRLFQRESHWTLLDPRLARRPKEEILEKKYASAFFGTALASTLHAHGIDTVLVAGAMTSDCVRASVVDALQHGFRPIVPRSCVGDRSPDAHHANLFDIHGKYGDVVELNEVLDYLTRQTRG